MNSSRFIWYELATSDLEGARVFYGGVLGWSFTESLVSGSPYSLGTLGKTPICGLMELPEDANRQGVRPSWTGYVGVDDVDATVDRVRQLGGVVYVPSTKIQNVSRFSVVADPQSAIVAVLQWLQSDREEGAAIGTHGRVGWHELLSIDWEKAWAFYSALFGWRKVVTDTDAMGSYQLFSDGLETTGGMFTKPATVPVPFWLFYFNVDDLDAAIARVTERGGHVINGPIEVPDGLWIFQCVDSQGAIFGLVGKRCHKRVIVAGSKRTSNLRFAGPETRWR